MPRTYKDRLISKQPLDTKMLVLFLLAVNVVCLEGSDNNTETGFGRWEFEDCNDRSSSCIRNTRFTHNCILKGEMRDSCAYTCKFCKPQKCKDRKKERYCKRKEKQNKCKKRNIKKICLKTCNGCPTISCFDKMKSRECEEQKYKCKKQWFRRRCPVTCGLCLKKLVKRRCEHVKERRVCKHYFNIRPCPNDIAAICPQSCGLCQEARERLQRSKCRDRKKAKFCKENKHTCKTNKQMKKTCAKTCGSCKIDPPTPAPTTGQPITCAHPTVTPTSAPPTGEPITCASATCASTTSTSASSHHHQRCQDHESTYHCISNIHYCSKYPKIMEFRCAHTCGFCKKRNARLQTRFSCEDTAGSHYCKKVKNHCKAQPDLMKLHCRKTCKLCEKACKTSACKRTEKRMLRTLDTTKDPCKDFYAFACGGEEKKRTKREIGDPHLDQYTPMNTLTLERLKSLLEEPDRDLDPYYAKQAKRFYASCMDQDTLEKNGIDPFIRYANREFPSRFALAPIVKAALKLNIQALFSLSIERFPRLYKIQLGDPRFILNPLSNYLSGRQPNRAMNAYKKRIDETLALAKEKLGRRNMDNILEFERNFAQNVNTRSTQTWQEQKWTTRTLAQFHNKYKNLLDWRSLFKEIFAMQGVNQTIRDSDNISFNQVYFDFLKSMYERPHARRDTNSYMFWNILAELSRYFSKEYQTIVSNYETKIRELNHAKPHYHSCVDETNIYAGEALGKMYVDEYFKPKARNEIERMISRLQETFRDLIDDSEWMSKSLKRSAKNRMIATYISVGYPELYDYTEKIESLYKDFNFWPHELFHNVIKGREELFKRKLREDSFGFLPQIMSGISYDEANECWEIPATFFDTIYDYGSPKSVTYGSLGATLAYKLNTIVDYNNNYTRLKECADKQMLSLPHELSEFKEEAQYLRHQQSLEHSFRTYRKMIEENGKEELPLPGLNFTHNQLFFLSYAQSHCRKTSKGNYYTPDVLRVLAPLQNSHAFNEAFQCKRDAFMNRREKIRVW